MQPSSAALAAAVVAPDRAPVGQVLIDWQGNGTFTDAGDDLTLRTTSITVDRSLTTDLPDPVRGVTGFTTAQASITVTGQPGVDPNDAVTFFSPYAAGSPLFGLDREGRTVRVQLGMSGDAGPELLPAFVGSTRSVAINVAGRDVQIEVLDNFEKMRGQVTLPLVVNDDLNLKRPGLNGAWVIDYTARRSGFYASPPPRATGGRVKFLATMAGSVYPEIGALTEMHTAQGDRPTFPTGRFVQGMYSDGSAGNTYRYATAGGTLGTNDTNEQLIQGWVYVSSPFGTDFAVCQLWSSTTVGGPFIGLIVRGSDRQLCATVRRRTAGTMGVYSSGLAVTPNTWTYVGLHIRFGAATQTMHWRVGGTSATTTGATSSVTGEPALVDLKLDSVPNINGAPCELNGAIEALQVENFPYGTAAPGTSGSPSWDDGFVASSIIQPSLNVLSATVPAASKDPAQLVRDLAAAELGTVGFDETGRFFFYNRDRWLSPPYTTSQRTISATDSIIDMQVSNSIDTIRNHVVVHSSPGRVGPPQFVWTMAGVTGVPASASITVWAQFDNPVTNLDPSVSLAPTSGATGTSSYRATLRRDGTGGSVTNLTFAVTPFADSAKIVITNPNAAAVWLVNPPGVPSAAGSPSFSLWGQPVTFNDATIIDSTGHTQSRYVADLSDLVSIARYGEQLLEISGNPWMQDTASAANLAAALLAQLKDPTTVMTSLDVVADPRLQLGDRVTVVDADGTQLARDFRIFGVRTTLGTSGMSQQLTVRST